MKTIQPAFVSTLKSEQSVCVRPYHKGRTRLLNIEQCAAPRKHQAKFKCSLAYERSSTCVMKLLMSRC